jgi:F420-dependent oxidoreductase-like protein
MDFRVFIEPQNGASYDDQLALARTAEALGFDGFFRSDHYLGMGAHEGEAPGPTDSWTTLAGLARETARIRLGTLVSSATHRLPAVLAIQVAQVDQMSGGRVELGLGTGWFEKEHRAFGMPFAAKRFGMLEEQLELITGLWATPADERYSFTGDHYTLVDAPGLPKPAQPRVPIIIGGSGPARTPALAARFADEYNAGFATLEPLAERIARVRAACEAIGRDPGSITMSIAGTTATGATTADQNRRADAAGQPLDSLRVGGFAGSAAEVADKIGALGELGFSRIYFQLLDIRDLDQADFIARDVLPQLER